MRTLLLAVICCTLVFATQNGEAQAFHRERGFAKDRPMSEKRMSVIKELRLSKAQREEIVAIVHSLQNDTRTLRRKRELLKEDYTLACVKEPQDDKEMKRILVDLQEVQTEINSMALAKMSEIKQLLTKTQLATLAELRQQEYERLLAAQKDRKGDASVENQAKQLPAIQSFSFSSWSNSSNEKLIDADQLFVYPDRELWMDNGSLNNFSFSTNEDGDLFGQPFENFFGGNTNRFNFQMPQLREFDSLQPESEAPDAMEDTPYTLPKGNKPRQAPLDQNAQMKKQLDEMRAKLRQMEQQLDKEKEEKKSDEK